MAGSDLPASLLQPISEVESSNSTPGCYLSVKREVRGVFGNDSTTTVNSNSLLTVI